MSKTIAINNLRERSKFLKDESINNLISKFDNNQINEAVFIYLTELFNLEDRTDSIQQLKETDFIYDNKPIKSTNIYDGDLDEEELGIRRNLCDSLGIKFEIKPHSEVIKELDGCLSDIKDKINPVEIIRTIREFGEEDEPDIC